MLHRTMCDVLQDMRSVLKTSNPDIQQTVKICNKILASLVEEAQVGANRMENALSMRRSIEYYESRYRKLKAEISELKVERDALLKDVPGHDDKDSILEELLDD